MLITAEARRDKIIPEVVRQAGLNLIENRYSIRLSYTSKHSRLDVNTLAHLLTALNYRFFNFGSRLG